MVRLQSIIADHIPAAKRLAQSQYLFQGSLLITAPLFISDPVAAGVGTVMMEGAKCPGWCPSASTKKLKNGLNRLAKATARSRSFLAAEAIGNDLDVQAWQIDQILQGIEEAETGKFVEHDRVVQQWERKFAKANTVDQERQP